ncbi:MAG: hypothetical protein HY721_31125 [Planctomycetes bacterium]|nr:hypothetical protein [Planctomycetota bacterium]
MEWKAIARRVLELGVGLEQELSRVFDEDLEWLPKLYKAYAAFRGRAVQEGSQPLFFEAVLRERATSTPSMEELTPLSWRSAKELRSGARLVWDRAFRETLGPSQSPHCRSVLLAWLKAHAKPPPGPGAEPSLYSALFAPAEHSKPLFDGVAVGVLPGAGESEAEGRGEAAASKFDDCLSLSFGELVKGHLAARAAGERRERFWQESAKRRLKTPSRHWYSSFVSLFFERPPEPPWSELRLDFTPPPDLWPQILERFTDCWKQAGRLDRSSRAMDEKARALEGSAQALVARAERAAVEPEVNVLHDSRRLLVGTNVLLEEVTRGITDELGPKGKDLRESARKLQFLVAEALARKP